MQTATTGAAAGSARRWLTLDGELARRIGTLAGPTVLAMISQTLINNTDHIMVGRIKGFITVGGQQVKESIAGQSALTPALALMWMVGGALSAISVGTQALTARRFGEGDLAGAGRVSTNSVAISLLMGIAASVLFVWLTPVLFPLVAKDPGVQQVGIPFLRWRYAAVLSMVVTASYKSFFDGLGQTRVHFVVAVVMNIVNFLLNYALIFGHWGLPRLGVEGSGIASCISSYLGCFMIIAWSFRKEIREAYQPYRLSNLSGALRREIARLSAPSTAAVIISLAGFAVFFKVCYKLDADAGHTETIFLSATNNIINIFQLVFISCIAYGTATATLVSQGLGAKQPGLAERFAFEAAKLGVLFWIAIGTCTALFPHFILHLWSDDLPVIEAAIPILRVVGLFEPFACIALVFMYALYGAGAARFVMKVELTLHLSCLIPLSYLLGVTFGLGLWGVWGAMIAYIVLMAVMMSWKFMQGDWKQIQI